MSKKSFLKIFALTLALILFISPLNALAEININESLMAETDSVQTMEEDISKRGEYEKHFLQSDGTYLATSYAFPVHKKAANGSFEEIDNTLKLKSGRLENADDDFKVSFAEKSNNELVSISKDIYNLSWGLSSFTDEAVLNVEASGSFTDEDILSVEASGSLTDSVIQNNKQSGTLESAEIVKEKIFTGAKASKRAIIDENEELELLSAKERKMVAEKASSALVYNDILGNSIDAKYTLTPGTVKEDIILNSPTDFSGYAMNITAEGLTPLKQEDNSVVFLNNEDEAIFILQTPYMYDEAGETSYDINIEVEETESGYRIVFTPNADWLKDDERVYPIVIDPTVYGTTGAGNLDTYIHPGDANSNHAGLNRLSVGMRTCEECKITSSVEHHAMIKPYLPEINNAIVTLVYFDLRMMENFTKIQVSAYRIKSDWTASAKHDNGYTYAALADTSTKVIAATGSNIYQWNITHMAKKWYSGEWARHGILFKNTDTQYSNYYQDFYACNNASPIMTVYYDAPATDIANGTYYLKNVNSNLYLDVPNGTSANGTDLIQHSFNGGTNQQFIVTRLSSGEYTLSPKCATGSAIEVTNTSPNNDAIIQIWNKITSTAYMPSQYFHLAKNSSNGSYRLLSRASNYMKAVVVQGASTSQAPIIQYDDNGTTNGHWVFVPVSTLSLVPTDVQAKFKTVANGGDFDNTAGLQCPDLTKWFIHTYTTLQYATGNGNLQAINTANKNGLPAPVSTPSVPAVFSVASGVKAWGSSGGSAGHTGIVLSIDTVKKEATVLHTWNALAGKNPNSDIRTYTYPTNGVTFTYLGNHLK